MSSEDAEATYTIARSVFEQTWRDYYSWAPPTNVPLSVSNIVISDDDGFEDPSLAFFEYLENYTSASKTGPTGVKPLKSRTEGSFAHRVKTASRSIVTTTIGSFALDSKVNPIPRYSFVIPTMENVVAPDEHRCPFIPILADDESFPDDQYLDMFNGRRTNSDMGRDAAVDLISFETRRRLLAAGFEDSSIEATRVLPEKHGKVASYEIERDLPTFPSEPLGMFGTAIDDRETRRWEEPHVVGLEEDRPGGGRPDMEELFCRNPECETFGCSLHIRGEYAVPLSAPTPHSLQDINKPRKPCSQHCCLNEDGVGSDWTDLDVSKLAVALESRYELCCDLRLAFPGRTCSEIYRQTCYMISHPDKSARVQLSSQYSRTSPVKVPTRRIGCRCRSHATKKGGTCEGKACECVRAQRECDPVLCGSCTEPESKCGNMLLQSQRSPKLRVGVSKVAGFGLFVDEDIEKDRLVEEYKGEIISNIAADKRDLIYLATGRNYLFQLCEDSLIDGANLGSLSRYINSDVAGANVTARVRSVGDDRRIALLTTRKIKRGEELFFDYGRLFHRADSNGDGDDPTWISSRKRKKVKR